MARHLHRLHVEGAPDRLPGPVGCAAWSVSSPELQKWVLVVIMDLAAEEAICVFDQGWREC